jgi:membrane protease YdiL (CAAX protease family)
MSRLIGTILTFESSVPRPERISCNVTRTWDLRSRPAFELLVGYVLILLVFWTPNPVQRVFFWTAFAWIIVATLLSRHADQELGFGVRRVRHSLWILGAVFMACVLAVQLAENLHLLHPLFGPKPLQVHVWGYLVWALLQQFILQDYFLLRLLRITESSAASVLIAAFLFAAAHLPNPVLTVATLFWGTAACFIFLRYRSLYVLAVAHWMFGLCLAITVPNDMSRHMRVGLGYIQYRADRRGAARGIVPLPMNATNLKTGRP